MEIPIFNDSLLGVLAFRRFIVAAGIFVLFVVLLGFRCINIPVHAKQLVLHKQALYGKIGLQNEMLGQQGSTHTETYTLSLICSL